MINYVKFMTKFQNKNWGRMEHGLHGYTTYKQTWILLKLFRFRKCVGLFFIVWNFLPVQKYTDFKQTNVLFPNFGYFCYGNFHHITCQHFSLTFSTTHCILMTNNFADANLQPPRLNFQIPNLKLNWNFCDNEMEQHQI